ncbi:hypothetical protein NEHOM01_0531 [Nematocida homosporus]|uniref:uncharacterized protein n=1 Tax=Nematocida homosporus TaxID=1912981 RepID=UPI00221F1295|nr:uncharacterized protein NEHOM01_0531 [Nematocida homosporus]KAI5184980.1 hypothetical protein NEHOM01_0531 [Nematocida homosporus]
MKLSFELLGIGVSGLLAWLCGITSGQVTSIADKAESAWEKHCIRISSSSRFANAAIEYDANPQCSKIDPKNEKVLGNTGPVEHYRVYWEHVLSAGLLSNSDTQRIIALLQNCHLINSQDVELCPFDLEKDSLSYALDKTIKKFEKYYVIGHEYAAKLGQIDKPTTGAELALLLGPADDDANHSKFNAILEPLLMDYVDQLFNWTPPDVFEWSLHQILPDVNTWRKIIQNPTATTTNLCAQKQLRHFLYALLQIQLHTSSFLSLSNKPQGFYHQTTINTTPRKELKDFREELELKAIDIIKTTSINDRSDLLKISTAASRAPLIRVMHSKYFQRTEFSKRLSHLHNSLLDGSTFMFFVNEIKQWSDDLKIVAERFKYIVKRTKQLQLKLKPYLTPTQTTPNIHDCVEYLTTDPQPNIHLPNDAYDSNQDPLFHNSVEEILIQVRDVIPLSSAIENNPKPPNSTANSKEVLIQELDATSFDTSTNTTNIETPIPDTGTEQSSIQELSETSFTININTTNTVTHIPETDIEQPPNQKLGGTSFTTSTNNTNSETPIPDTGTEQPPNQELDESFIDVSTDTNTETPISETITEQPPNQELDTTPSNTNTDTTNTETSIPNTTTSTITSDHPDEETESSSPSLNHSTPPTNKPSSAASHKPWWKSSSPIFHVAISSLFWTRLTNLLGLSH